MLYKTKGIVLHTLKYGDTSIIAHLYTREFGRQSYLIRGLRGKKSKFSPGYFQPLTLLELQVDHKENRELQMIRDLKEVQSLYHVHSDIIKSTIALFLGEVLYRCLREVEGNRPLFDYIETSIQLLDVSETAIVNFHLVFLMQFTRFLGIYPINNLELTHYQPKEVELKLQDLLNFTLKDLNQLKLSNRSRNLLVTSIIDYYYYHLEGMGKISSMEILHEVFS